MIFTDSPLAWEEMNLTNLKILSAAKVILEHMGGRLGKIS